jgi:hypothetical protein
MLRFFARAVSLVRVSGFHDSGGHEKNFHVFEFEGLLKLLGGMLS